MYTKHNYFSHIKILFCNQASLQNVVNFKFYEMSLRAKFEKLACMKCVQRLY